MSAVTQLNFILLFNSYLLNTATFAYACGGCYYRGCWHPTCPPLVGKNLVERSKMKIMGVNFCLFLISN